MAKDLKFCIRSLILIMSAPAISRGQQYSPPHHEFETASVRAMHWSEGCYSKFPSGGMHYELRCVTLRELIALAWQVHPDDIQSVDASAMGAVYDLKATTPGDKPWTREDIPPMLRALLAQRFHVSARRGTKEVSGYTLEVAKGGATLKPAKNSSSVDVGQNIIVAGYLRGRGVDLTGIAALVSAAMREKVVDRTGMSGTYDIDLNYASNDDPTATDPSIFTALKEQLGLTLQRGKVLVNTVVVEHADESPTLN